MSEPDPLDEVPLACLVGKSAVGKSDLAVQIAERAGAEIVSLDSMLVYRGMDVGTAKPGAELLERVPHHVIDVVDPPERYDVTRWLEDARRAVRGIHERGARPLFVGGTGFFLQALVRGIFRGPAVDPEVRRRLEERFDAEGAGSLFAELERRDPASAGRLHANDRKRVVRALEVLEQTGRPLSAWQESWGWHGNRPSVREVSVVGLERPAEELEQRIAERTDAMLAAGWIEEAREIRDGPGFGPTSIQALGYREVLAHLEGELGIEELAERIRLRTRQFTRRQGTWFRKFDVRWVSAVEARAAETAEALLFGRS